MMTTFNPHFLVISLGNRGHYYQTLHSAGHFALISLQKAISNAAGTSSPSTSPEGLYQPAFATQKYGKFRCQRSVGSKYMLLQSSTLMNASGRFVTLSWDQFLKDHTPGGGKDDDGTKKKKMKMTSGDGDGGDGGDMPRPNPNPNLSLVVVHDDLEEAFGTVKIRPWESSHRGHNGLKSIHTYLKAKRHPWAPGRWSRICVGIGRPESRENFDVAKYVLSRLTGSQKEILDAEVGSRVLACLEMLEADWRRDHEGGPAVARSAALDSTPQPDGPDKVDW